MRDKVKSKFKYNFKSTDDIISTLNNKKLPAKIMTKIHPQRWNDNMFLWFSELACQNIKNLVKVLLK